MKNFVFLFIPLVGISFGCLAQSNNRMAADSGKGNSSGSSSSSEEDVVVSYHVVEKVGGNITTYNVSDLSLVNSNDLGPNNSRVITPKFGKAKTKRVPNKKSQIFIAEKPPVSNPLKVESPNKIFGPPPVKKKEFIIVDILSTYERILEKGGYESVEMVKKVADNRYFKGELTAAYKWYAQLFSLTSDFDVVYYYRYAQALKSVGQVNKADEMMKVFESKLTK